MATLTQQSFANPTTSYFLKTEDASNVASNWSFFPALQTVDIASNSIENVSSINFIGTQPSLLYADGTHLFYNNQIIVNASDLQEIGDWALYPAVSNIDANNNSIQNISSLELNTEIITATPTSLLVNGNDPTANWSLFSGIQDTDIGGFSILDCSQIQLTNQIISATPSAVLVNGTDQTSYWSNFPAINISTQTINGLSNFGTSNWATFPAIANVDMSKNTISNVQEIVGSLTSNGMVLSNTLFLKSGSVGMTIGGEPIDKLNSVVDVWKVRAGDNLLCNGAVEVFGQLLAYGGVGGHTLGTANVAGVFTNRIDVLAVGGIDLISPLFITANATGAINLASGVNTAIAAGGAVVLQAGTKVFVQGPTTATCDIVFTNGGDISGANTIDCFRSTPNQLYARGLSSNIDVSANLDMTSHSLLNVSGINGSSYPPASTWVSTATSALNMNNFVISNTPEITASGIPVASTLNTRTSNTIYVAKNGNDANSGSQNLPKLTIQNAITTLEALSLTNQTQSIIFVAPGHYTENLTYSSGYIHTFGDPDFDNANELCEITGNITISMNTGVDDLFNRQVHLQGFQITGKISNTSSKQGGLALVNCKVLTGVGGTLIDHEPTSANSRFYIQNCVVQHASLSATNTAPLIQISGNTFADIQQLDTTALDNVPVLDIGGNSTVRMFIVDLVSTTSISSAQPVMTLTSRNPGVNGIGLTNFTYTSPSAKNATSAGLLMSNASAQTVVLLNSTFGLGGTTSPTTRCVSNVGAGLKTIATGNVLSAPGTTGTYDPTLIRLPYSVVS